MYDYTKYNQRYVRMGNPWDSPTGTGNAQDSLRFNKSLYAAGTAAGIFGNLYSAWSTAGGMENDARTAKAMAEEAKARATYQESQLAREGARLMATQQLLFQTAGVTMEGSPSLFLADTQKELSMDAQILRREGLKEYLQLREQSKALNRAAGDTRAGAFLGAFGEIMGSMAFL